MGYVILAGIAGMIFFGGMIWLLVFRMGVGTDLGDD